MCCIWISAISLLTLTITAMCMEIPNSSTIEIDYTTIASAAERRKTDVINFLEDSTVRKQYKQLYDTLLKKLKDDSEGDTRRDLTRRIVMGRNTSIEALPWQGSLRDRTFAICGATVLTDIWLLTAAHCLLKAKPNDLSVRLGSSWRTHGGEMYDVRKTYVHPKYVAKKKQYDVGLLELYSPLRFSARVLPIGLIEKNARLKAGIPTIVSGWGKLRESGPTATYLQSTTVETIAMKQCKQSGLDHKAINPPTMFCAGSFHQPSPDACQGDSGGPIVHDGLLIGVVSWGLGCARGNFPGVYSRLAEPDIADWMRSHINKNVCKPTS